MKKYMAQNPDFVREIDEAIREKLYGGATVGNITAADDDSAQAADDGFDGDFDE